MLSIDTVKLNLETAIKSSDSSGIAGSDSPSEHLSTGSSPGKMKNRSTIDELFEPLHGIVNKKSELAQGALQEVVAPKVDDDSATDVFSVRSANSSRSSESELYGNGSEFFFVLFGFLPLVILLGQLMRSHLSVGLCLHTLVAQIKSSTEARAILQVDIISIGPGNTYEFS